MSAHSPKFDPRHPFLGLTVGVIKAATGVAFIAAALSETVGVWVGGPAQRWLEWALPLAGALIGYWLSVRRPPESDSDQIDYRTKS